MIDAIKNLSQLSNIPESNLRNINKQLSWIIIDSLNLSNEQDQVDIDLGIGTLLISNEGDSIRYRFKPSKELEQSILRYYEDGTNPLKSNLELKLGKKLLNTYKDIL